jgi:chorismate mutase/prephenate dehydratase
LAELRRRVDRLDERIVRLLAERMELGGRILEAKAAQGMAPYDPAREQEVLQRLQAKAGEKIPRTALEAIYREIISATRTLQTQEPVVFLGGEGGLAHYAASLRFGSSATLVGVRRAQDLFEAVGSGRSRYGVFTLEAAGEQASLESLDRFLDTPLRIFAEFYVEDTPGLFLAPGTRRVRRVFAHPSALGACSRWVEAQAEGLEIVPTATDLEAGRRGRRRGSGALGYPLLEMLFGLERSAEAVADDPGQWRRFLVLSREELPRTGRDKTSFLAVIPNRPGQLHRVTEILWRHGINLCWIQPRATRFRGWDHIFWLEVEGHREEEPLKAALSELRAALDFVKVLGSYPTERPPGRPF